MEITRFRRTALAAAAGLTAIALTACSGGGAATPTSGASDGAEDTTPATINLILAPVFYEPVYIAQEKGYFADQNLTVNIVQGGTAAENTAQLISGQADIAMSSAAAQIPAVAQGIPLQAILGATSSDPDVVTSGLLVAPGSSITGPKDFAGKTICLQGLNETTHLGTLLLMKGAGISDPLNAAKFVQLPLADLVPKTLDGTCDVSYPIGNAYAAGLAQGMKAVGQPSTDVLALGPSVTYAATKDYIAANESVVKRFQAAIEKAAELGRQDDFAEIRAIQHEYSKTASDVIDSQILAGYQTDMYTSGWQKTIDGMVEFGMLDHAITIDEAVSSLAPMQP